jgi:hypothetical protein
MKGAYGMWFRSGESLRSTKPGDETRFDTIMNVYERSRAAAAERDMRINLFQKFRSARRFQVCSLLIATNGQRG